MDLGWESFGFICLGIWVFGCLGVWVFWVKDGFENWGR